MTSRTWRRAGTGLHVAAACALCYVVGAQIGERRDEGLSDPGRDRGREEPERQKRRRAGQGPGIECSDEERDQQR